MTTMNDLGKLLVELKSHAASTARRRGECPQDRKTREQLISDFGGPGSSSTRGCMRYIALPEPYLPCLVPFSQLTKIMLRDLLLETHHRGRYLIVRTLTKPTRFDGVVIVVEDELGDAGLVDLYNQVGTRVHEETEAGDLPPTGVYVLKEPFFHISQRGEYVVRADHVSDVVWLPDNDERVPPAWSAEVRHKTPDDWRREGLTAFHAGYYRQAIAKYTTALACAGVDEIEQCAIRLLRGLAYAKRECYEQTLADVSCLPAELKLEEWLYRPALFLYHMGRFDECQSRLAELLTHYPESKPGQELLLRARRRLHEQMTGQYDFLAMYQQLERGEKELDIATYTGPLVVGQSEGRGRGLFTAEAVKAGQLLSCEKAAVYCRAPVEGMSSKDRMYLYVVAFPHEFMSLPGAKAELATQAVQKILRKSSAASSILESYSGAYEHAKVTEPIDGQCVVDYFHLQNIVRLTAFGCSTSTYNSLYAMGPLEEHELKADEETSTLKRFAYNSGGLWPFTALINHSCNSNVSRTFIGDALILRAAVDLPAGAELLTSYVMQGDPAAATKLRAFWGIECHCVLCADARRTPHAVVERRQRAVDLASSSVTGFRAIRQLTQLPVRNADAMVDRAVRRAERRTGLRVDLPAVEARVLEAAREFAQPRPAAAPAAGTAGAGTAGAGAAGAAGAGAGAAATATTRAAASGEWVPRHSLAYLLLQLSTTYAEAASRLPASGGSNAPNAGGERRAHADKAVAYALAALRQLGYVIREDSGRWRRDRDGSGGGQGVLAGPVATGADAQGAVGQPPPPLVVVQWGARTIGVERIWFSLVRGYRLGGAPAALADAAKEYARTCYCFMIGEDVTFEREFATAMSGA